MATTKPRVSVTLEPEMYAELRDLARLNRESLSAVIGGLLYAVAPTVHRAVVVGRQFQRLSEEMQAEIRDKFTDAEIEITPALQALTEKALAALAAVGEAEQDPRPVTRGSRTPLKSVGPTKSGRSR